MDNPNKNQNMVRSILTGIGVTVIYLFSGTVLDYIVTQTLSQFFVADCSEDCYFRIFNGIFILVVILSALGGLRAGMRTYKRLSV